MEELKLETGCAAVLHNDNDLDVNLWKGQKGQVTGMLEIEGIEYAMFMPMHEMKIYPIDSGRLTPLSDEERDELFKVVELPSE